MPSVEPGPRPQPGGALECTRAQHLTRGSGTWPRHYPPEQLRTLRSWAWLRVTVKRILDGQPFGAQRLAAAGLGAPEAIGSVDDLARLPFTSKADLRAHYPFGLLAVGREQIVRVHASSGTHGQPTVIGYTRADLETGPS